MTASANAKTNPYFLNNTHAGRLLAAPLTKRLRCGRPARQFTSRANGSSDPDAERQASTRLDDDASGRRIGSVSCNLHGRLQSGGLATSLCPSAPVAIQTPMGSFTSKLPNMPGTRLNRSRGRRPASA